MLRSLRKVYCSAPTHVATDNFAARLEITDARVTDRYNKGKSADDTTRARRKLIVRPYKLTDEVEAFRNLLRHPHDADRAAPRSSWKPESKWRLHLSCAYWLLALLRSPAVKELHRDASPALHDMQSALDNKEDLERLRDVATGAMDWTQYEEGTMVEHDTIKALLEMILSEADALCTTPSMSCKKPCEDWKNEIAKGIAVDEAGNINRPDLYSVWGNTLLPCLLAGDDKQLSPAVMTLIEKSSEGHYLNRFALDGKISPLAFFKGCGWPIYRLHTQLRMAKGLFEICHQEVYSDVPFDYGTWSDVSLPQHAVGRALEAFLKTEYPELKPAPQGELRPVFIHCEGSRCFVDKVTSSKRSPDQVKIALDILSSFVKQKKVDPTQLVMITPYKANVEVINKMRQQPGYENLGSMQPAATVDSFQGREGDIAIIIMGTTKAVGPGFTTDEQRLNVMLSRQKSGLLIFGDINTTGDLKGKGKDKDKGKGKGKGKGGKGKGDTAQRFEVISASGEKHWVKALMLHNVHSKLYEAGRVINILVDKTKGEQTEK